MFEIESWDVYDAFFWLNIKVVVVGMEGPHPNFSSIFGDFDHSE